LRFGDSQQNKINPLFKKSHFDASTLTTQRRCLWKMSRYVYIQKIRIIIKRNSFFIYNVTFKCFNSKVKRKTFCSFPIRKEWKVPFLFQTNKPEKTITNDNLLFIMVITTKITINFLILKKEISGLRLIANYSDNCSIKSHSKLATSHFELTKIIK